MQSIGVRRALGQIVTNALQFILEGWHSVGIIEHDLRHDYTMILHHWVYCLSTAQNGKTPMDLDNPAIKALLVRAPELRRDALIRMAMARRRSMMLQLRRAHEAHRDARLVFRAAAEGRPLELQRRLVLGKLAGGLDILGEVGGVMMTPLDAARAGGHGECIKMIKDRPLI